MDEDSSTKFIGSLTKFLQSLCNGYVEFRRGVELVGHIYLSIDTGEKVDYILHEKVSKNDENSVTFVSNSFHAQPQDKDKPKEGSSKSGANERSRDTDDTDDDIMIVDQSRGTIGSTNSGSVPSRGAKRAGSPSADYRHGQRARTFAGSHPGQNRHSFPSVNRQHTVRPSATVTSQGASSQNENLNIGEVKLEQISSDEILSLTSQVDDGGTAMSHASSRSHPQHPAVAASGSGGSRGDPAMWVKREVPDDDDGGTDAGNGMEEPYGEDAEASVYLDVADSLTASDLEQPDLWYSSDAKPFKPEPCTDAVSGQTIATAPVLDNSSTTTGIEVVKRETGSDVEDSSCQSDLDPLQRHAGRMQQCRPQREKYMVEKKLVPIQAHRNQGKLVTPKQKLSGSKKAAPNTWKKNVRKALRLQGKEYVSETGKTVSAKKMRDVDCSSLESKCRFNCHKISESERRDIFESFYSLGDHDKQKAFILCCVQEKQTKKFLGEDSEPISNKRNVSRSFSFNVGGQQVRVCKRFFLATLCVSETYVYHALKRSQQGRFIGRDKSSPKRPANKTPREQIKRVKAHIESFSVLESHDVDKGTQRTYPSSKLTVKKMFELYKEECKNNGHTPVSEGIYRKIFSEDYN